MFSQYFAQYLLNHRILSADKLYQALEFERSVHVKLGVLAINAGFMAAEQVELIHALQRRNDKRFGELAIEKGYLTYQQLDNLLDAQGSRCLTLTQVIVEKGFLTLEQLEQALNNYKKECMLSNEQWKATEMLNVDEAARFILNFSGEQADLYYDYVAVMLRNMVRLLNEQPIILHNVPVRGKWTGWLVSQEISGDIHFCTGLVMNDGVLLEIARRYSGKDLKQPDERARNYVAEFLNVNNEIFSINSANLGIELELKSWQIGTDKDLNGFTGQAIPLDTAFGQLHLILI